MTRAEQERKDSADADTDQSNTSAVPLPGTSRKTAAKTTLESFIAKRQTWAADHPSAQLATKYLAEMIATVLQPYSIVENNGFVRYSRNLEPRHVLPSRRSLSECIIPDIHDKVKESVKKSVLAAKKSSFTTATWTETSTTKAFIGVSAHWVSNDWERKFAVLNCKEFSGRHSGEMMAQKFETVLADWNIPKQSCHVVIHDNAANMVRAFRCANIPSVGCALHTLQLSIHDCICEQKTV